MSAPDLLYGEVEDELRASVRKLLDDHCEAASVLARCESAEPYDLALWHRMADELGLAGLLVPEEAGGSGASAREAGVVAEELGRSVAPVPFLGSAALTTGCLLEPAADGEATRDLLGAVCAGTRITTLAVPLPTAPSDDFPRAVSEDGAGLNGRVRGVVDLPAAGTVLVPATGADGPTLYAVDLPGPGARCETTTPLDLTRQLGDLVLEGASGRRILSGEPAERAVRQGLTVAAGLLACEQLGLAQRCLDSTVDYVRTRYQFGRPVGSFQAIKHRLADLWAAVSTARAVARAGVDGLATGSEPDLNVSLAQAYCSDTAVLVAEEALQLHGGIGMTWEHPLHLYLGRAKSAQLALGSPERHRQRIAVLADVPVP